jgi:hypothetical protein
VAQPTKITDAQLIRPGKKIGNKITKNKTKYNRFDSALINKRLKITSGHLE